MDLIFFVGRIQPRWIICDKKIKEKRGDRLKNQSRESGIKKEVFIKKSDCEKENAKQT